MSLHALLECAVHIDVFRNIDLFQQGLYQVRVRMYLERDKEHIPLQPYDLRVARRSKEPLPDPHHVTASHIAGRAYRSNSFLVKYTDEEIGIADVCCFRTEAFAEPHTIAGPLHVAVRLMFLESSSNTSYEYLASMSVDQKQFSEVSRTKLTIHSPFSGAHAYFPVVFDDTHFSAVDIAIHTALIDYRFAPSFQPTPHAFSTALFPKSPSPTDADITHCEGSFLKPFRRSSKSLLWVIEAIKQKLTPTDLEMLAALSHQSPATESNGTDHSAEVRFRKVYLPGSFVQRVLSHDAEIAGKQLIAEVHELSPIVSQLWEELLKVSQASPHIMMQFLRKQFEESVAEWFGDSVFRRISRVESLPLQGVDITALSHAEIAIMRRRSGQLQDPLPVSDTRLIGTTEPLPILFEDAYVPLDALLEDQVSRRAGKHLFVLVHGFQGSALDVRLFKNHISLLRPNAIFLCSSSNQNNTDGDIREMGQLLANEVRSHVREWCPDGSLHRLSFIGHSLGGLVARAALEFLGEFEFLMELMMTLATPHLGCMYNDSRLIDAGLWFLMKWRKSRCLSQLMMTDASEARETFLYQLAVSSRLHWFRNILLLSSSQDLYAPFESARIELTPKAAEDQHFGRIFAEMVEKLLAKLPVHRLRRVDVHFDLSSTSVDSVIGRKAHIQFLENPAVIKTLLFCFAEVFT